MTELEDRQGDEPPGREQPVRDAQGAEAQGAEVRGAEMEGAEAQGAEPPRLGGPPGPIERDDPFAVAGRKAMWLHVKRLLEVDAALRDPDKAHDLKRYRVATRRLRAAMRAFEEAFPKREIKALRDDLADLATVAGAARDLDVRIADLQQWAEARGDETLAGIQPLAATWQAERAAAAARLDARLRKRRHARLLEDLVAFVESTDAADAPGARAAGRRPGGSAEAGIPARPIGLRAGTLLWQGYERVMAYDGVVRRADLATLHQLRIEAKRLRYLLEFLAAILGPESADLVARLVAVQDHLGMLNDASVTSTAVRAFLEAPTTHLQAAEHTAIAAYLQDRQRAITRLQRGATRPWRGVAGLVFARALAKALIAR